MRPDLTEIITTLMQSYGEDGYYDESIIKGIRSLASNWPNLTEEEKKEVEAVATAFQIMSDDTNEESAEWDNQEIESESKENGYVSFYEQIEQERKSHSTTYSDDKVQKRGLFRRRKNQ